jgi:hypothetical protein
MRGVWNRKREDQGSLEPEEGGPGESGNGRGKNKRVWNRKREEQGSLKPEEGRQAKCGTERESTGGFAKIYPKSEMGGGIREWVINY